MFQLNKGSLPKHLRNLLNPNNIIYTNTTPEIQLILTLIADEPIKQLQP